MLAGRDHTLRTADITNMKLWKSMIGRKEKPHESQLLSETLNFF